MNVLDNKKNKDVYLKMFPITLSKNTLIQVFCLRVLVSKGTGFAKY